jgi:hypothetical protein
MSSSAAGGEIELRGGVAEAERDHRQMRRGATVGQSSSRSLARRGGRVGRVVQHGGRRDRAPRRPGGRRWRATLHTYGGRDPPRLWQARPLPLQGSLAGGRDPSPQIRWACDLPRPQFGQGILVAGRAREVSTAAVSVDDWVSPRSCPVAIWPRR